MSAIITVTLQGLIYLRNEANYELRRELLTPPSLRGKEKKQKILLLRKEIERLQNRIDNHPSQPRQLTFDDCAAFSFNVSDKPFPG